MLQGCNTVHMGFGNSELRGAFLRRRAYGSDWLTGRGQPARANTTPYCRQVWFERRMRRE